MLARALSTGGRDQPDSPGWLRSPGYDLGLIGGVLALALALGSLAKVRPELLPWVLLLDFWLLAYPHVASSYTRIAFDRESARKYRFLLFGLPPIVLLGTASVAWLGGVLALNTVYFTWQTWHYTRQSYGIARVYQRRGGRASRDLLSDCVVFAFPVWGLVNRAHQQHATFYGSPLLTLPVPKVLVILTGAFAMGSLAAWTLRHLMQRGAPEQQGHALFLLSHVVITVVSYVVIDEITQGWLFINIWHNAQYLLFVWAINARQFQGGIDPEKRLLSRLCQRENAGYYAAVCLGVSAIFYLTIGRLLALTSPWQALPIVLVCHQTVNFHHYLVDAVIWKSPKRPAEAQHA